MPDPAHDLCLRLVEDTRRLIRADRERASVPVAKLLDVIDEHLLDPDLDVNALLRLSGQRNKNLSTRFAAELGLAPKAYITEKRMELAGRMLVASTFQVWRVGSQVGYLTPGSFNRAFKAWSGQSPSAFRKAARDDDHEAALSTPTDLVSRRNLQQAIDGELPPEQAGALVDRLFDLGEEIRANYGTASRSPAGWLAVESTMARNLWELIESQSWEMQTRAVESQAPAYRGMALFNRLSTLCVEARDAGQAQHLSRLALIAAIALGKKLAREERLNVYACAWAVAGNAQRVGGDLDVAELCFAKATLQLAEAGDAAHPIIIAQLYFFQAVLELVRGNSSEAAELMDAGQELLQQTAGLLSEEEAAILGPLPQL